MDIFDKVKIGIAVLFTGLMLVGLVHELCGDRSLLGVLLTYIVFYIPITFIVWVKMLPER